MSVVYSPLCDRSEVAYAAYLRACSDVASGSLSGGVESWASVGQLRSDWERCGEFFGFLRSFSGSSGGPFGTESRVESGAAEGERVVGERPGLGGVGSGVRDGDGVDGGKRGDVEERESSEQLGRSGSNSGDAAVVGLLNGSVGVPPCARGPNYERNRVSREKKKRNKKLGAMAGVPEWRRKAVPSPPSLSPTVETVTTEVAEELEARRTLALRRSAENRVAVALAEHRLRSLADKDKTAALAKLDAARVEQRINDAKAKSQASYKKCDESLGSLGSTGSAGEFALKKEVQAAKDEVLAVKRQRDYYEKQLSVSFSYISPEGMRAVAELPEPVYDDDRVDDCGLDELPEDMPVNDKVAYLTRMGCQDAAEALLFETYGF